MIDTVKPSLNTGKALVPFALIIAVCAISFAAIFFKKAAPTHPLVAAGIRLAVAALLLSPFTIRAARSGNLRGRMLWSAAIAGIAYGVHFGSWVSSLSLTSVAASVTLVTTTPLILAVAGVVTGKDKPQGRLWMSLGIAFCGLLLIGGKDFSLGPEVLLGDGLAVLGALAMASYMIIARRLGHDLNLMAFSGVATAVGAAVLLGWAWILKIPLYPASGEAMIYLVLAAILPQLVGHNLITWSLRHTTPSVVGMAVVGEPVGATILAWAWLGESVTALVALGCGVTLLAVIIAISGQRTKKDPLHKN